jgi:hypothetical protein
MHDFNAAKTPSIGRFAPRGAVAAHGGAKMDGGMRPKLPRSPCRKRFSSAGAPNP